MLSSFYFYNTIRFLGSLQLTTTLLCFTLLIGAFLALCLNTKTYIYVLICLEFCIVLTSLLIFLSSITAFNNVAITFFLLLLAAGETAILLSLVVSTSESYRFISNTNKQNFYI